MKKLIILVISILVFSSCQDVLEEEFKNPHQYEPNPDQLASGMFTNTLLQYKFYIKDYGELWWQLSGNGMPSYAQISTRYITPRYSWFIDYDDLTNGNGFSQSGFNWFNDYYLRMRNWGLIQDVLTPLEGQDYDDSVIYFKLLTIIKDWATLRNVDLYNSIPYFNAFKGTQGEFFTEYDDPKEIYVSVLEDLKTIAGELPGIYSKMSPDAQALLVTQDIALQGDISKWVQYTNALRLRFAVKLSGVDEATAKSHIAEAIQNLPTEDLSFDLPHIDAAAALPGGGTWQRGLFERPFVTFIPNVILNRMNFHNLEYEEDIDDPRLPVIALPTKHNDYRGVSMDADAQTPIYNGGERYYPWADDLETSSENNAKSMYSHVTLTHNNLPADMFTLGEIDLLLAEVAAKNLATTGKTAGEHIEDAIVHSTNYWYYLNSLSQYGADFTGDWADLIRPDKPSDAVITSYAEKVKNAFNAVGGIDNQMEILMQQKYIHLNMLRPIELWSELRRTRHPKLEPMTFQGKVMKPVPERLMYPSSELSTNADAFLKVIDQNNFTSPIFWRTDASSYYRDDYITFKTGLLPDFN
ncbi:SusD/RagB family nutrient-binding outer membrane lipoprotein [Aureibaculum sp. 2210JD6-5]|uniref:SusD/RagB family nutrient-binding outer membrane lipoprotein n=1 Tax=Aureibaculum sp. 2210JD6-5 TaxID=3103957 RepID=UPI002AACAC88|nr:SusD/RagB family nutrient-binding outer membrane lipoprotein [Aureibaculum sp. 2210JD6-5]MDY7394310.1 SusD/RagB family nutrient-binding outer membrane lipoprotein [Aureibaculum sp. 2210JD6-5]